MINSYPCGIIFALWSLSYYFAFTITPYHLILLSVTVLRRGLSRTLIFSRHKCKKIEPNQLNLLSILNHFSGTIFMLKCTGEVQIKMNFKIELLSMKATTLEDTLMHPGH